MVAGLVVVTCDVVGLLLFEPSLRLAVVVVCWEKKNVVSNQNMLVSLQKRKKKKPVAQTMVNRCLGPCVLMVVAVGRRRRGSHTVQHYR